MAIACGVDVIRISRVRDLFNRKGDLFLDRVFTKSETEACTDARGELSMESLAARFSAKEAVSKALGTGIWRQGIGFTDIEISVDDYGKPTLLLHGAARQAYDRMGGTASSVSISHDGDMAIAMCVMEFRGESPSGDNG
ncbi:MAG: holo-ACP synthase [Clostridiales bacterium]|nr:holo-ACP synthase [Clostridiales bacterium]